jgi:uncharacterized membrane protein
LRVIQITHLTPGRFGEPLLEVRMMRGVSGYPAALKGVFVGFAVLCLGVSGSLALMGAVPVLGFAGLELVLLFVLLRVAFRRASTEEGVKVAGDATVVEREGPRGRYIIAQLESYWLRIEPTLYGAQGIILRSRHIKVAVGAGLPESEVRDLTVAVQGALHRVKNEAAPG